MCKMYGLKLLVFGLVLSGGNVGIGKSLADDCPNVTDVDNLPQDKFIAYLTNECRYDKNVPPASTTPLTVNIKMHITHIDATLSQLTTYMNVFLQYQDRRLKYNPNRSIILGDQALKAQIWTPNILMKDKWKNTILSNEQKDPLIAINSDGEVTYSYKSTVKFNCPMNLQKFPFDSQNCTLAFSDWNYDNSSLKLEWADKPGAPSHFSEYILDTVGNATVDIIGPYQTSDEKFFSELLINIHFYRDVSYYLLDFFIPSYLLVFTAWVTFWLQADAGPPRATLGASTIVAFITLHLGVSKDIPKVSYVKASDIWFFGVILFIFLSLAEFAFVNVIWRRRKQVELKKPKPKYILKGAFTPRKAREELRRYESQQTLDVSVISQSIDSLNSIKPINGSFKRVDSGPGNLHHSTISIPEEESQEFGWTTMTPREVAIYVDRKARIVFPIAFLFFNVAYWLFVYWPL